jgi:hypothetical protein
MFESDQSDLHEEIEELRLSAPVKPAGDTRDSSFYEAQQVPEESVPLPEFPEQQVEAKKTSKLPFIVVSAGVLVVMLLAMVFISRPKKTDEPLPGDLGPGVFAQSGLRGHLLTQWDGNAKTGSAKYQLRLEPMGPLQAKGFAAVTGSPTAPLSVNVRVLDVSGFALCGKQIVFHFEPKSSAVPLPANLPQGKKGEAARAAAQAAQQAAFQQMQAAEVDREHGKDIFQNQADADGVISAVNAQGTLPCSPDQYKRAYYWDFNSDFPTLDEQLALVDPKAAAEVRREKGLDKTDPNAHRRSAPRKPQSAYYVQGDDRVTGFDPTRGILEAAAGKSFIVANAPEQAIVATWAHNYSLIHYKCDQHASCALSSAGGMSVVYAHRGE